MELVKESKFSIFLQRAYLKHDLKDPVSLSFDIFYMMLITTALVFSVLHILGVFSRENLIFILIESGLVFLFFIEWVIRFAYAEKTYQETSVLYSKIRFFVNYESIIDILCLLMFIVLLGLEGEDYVNLIAGIHLLRVFKYLKYPVSYYKNKKQ